MYAFQAEKYHILPEAGGLRQQPARLMLTIHECLATYRAIIEQNQLKPGQWAAWKKENPDKARLVRIR